MRWVGHVARIGEERGVYRVLVMELEGKTPVGSHRRRWVHNINGSPGGGVWLYGLDWFDPG